MKWVWVFFIVVFVPISASGGTYNMKKGDEIFDVSTLPLLTYILDGTVEQQSETVRVAKIMALPLRDLPSVRIAIRLFFSKDLLPSEHPKGRCYIKIEGEGVFPLQDYFIYTGHGPEVWMPHLRDRQKAEIYILWEPGAPVLPYARTVTGNGVFQRKTSWMTKLVWDSMKRISEKDRLTQFVELRLDDVCAKPSREESFPFSEQDLKTFQFVL